MVRLALAMLAAYVTGYVRGFMRGWRVAVALEPAPPLPPTDSYIGALWDKLAEISKGDVS